MNAIVKKLSPSATNMIRMDHTRVIAAFHRYDIAAKPAVKRAVVNTVCLSLEIHAQLEEEIFYPALRSVDPQLIAKSVPEHDEMRLLIATLRSLEPDGEHYDRAFMGLMHVVIHHVADEETLLLPQAELAMGDRLADLGARMARRRLQLMAPRAGELAVNTARSMSTNTLLVGAGAVVAAALVVGSWKRAHRSVL